MIFGIYLHFSCSNFTFHLITNIYSSSQLSIYSTIFYTINCSKMLMPTILLPQCSDPRLTSSESQLVANQYHSCHFESTCKDRGQRQRPTENCKDRLDSSESRDEIRCLQSISGKERTCKDSHCKDIGLRPPGSLLKSRDWTQNRAHSPKRLLLAHVVFALLFAVFSFPPLPTTPTNFSQRCLLGNRPPNCPHCSCFLGEWQFYNIPKLFRNRPYYLPNGMLVYKTKFCYSHTSVWYFRRGKRKYATFTGAKQTAMHKHGLPGDRGSFFKNFASYQSNFSYPDTIKRSRILLCGKGPQTPVSSLTGSDGATSRILQRATA